VSQPRELSNLAEVFAFREYARDLWPDGPWPGPRFSRVRVPSLTHVMAATVAGNPIVVAASASTCRISASEGAMRLISSDYTKRLRRPKR